MMEEDILVNINDGAIDTLSERVNALKHIALDIHTEMQEQNMLIDRCEGAAIDSRSLLSKATDGIDKAIKSGTGSQMCWLVAFMLGTFVLLWRLM